MFECLMKRTDTTLDQDCGTEGNRVCMYIVHCRVIVDNKCEFQHKTNISKSSKKCLTLCARTFPENCVSSRLGRISATGKQVSPDATAWTLRREDSAQQGASSLPLHA